MFAHENDGDLRSKAAKRRCIGGGEGDVVPCPGVGQARLMGKIMSEVKEEKRTHILCLWSATCWAEGHRCIEEGGCQISRA